MAATKLVTLDPLCQMHSVHGVNSPPARAQTKEPIPCLSTFKDIGEGACVFLLENELSGEKPGETASAGYASPSAVCSNRS